MNRSQLVYRWDLDKTYLRTEFDTIADLIRTAFEPASRKQTVPGAAALLRELRGTNPAGIHILSGSPEQMRRVLETKLRLDGVEWDSFTLKPSLRKILRGRFRFVRDQVGYKLGALLESRASLPPETVEIMFGDDAEADAFIYSMYADLCAGLVDESTLERVLVHARVFRSDVDEIMHRARGIPRGSVSKLIFIHLDRMSDPKAFAAFGSRVCPFYNYFQPALLLLQEAAMDVDAVLRVATELILGHAFGVEELFASMTDLARRGHLVQSTVHTLTGALHTFDRETFATTSSVLEQLGVRLKVLGDDVPQTPQHSPSEPLDYVHVLAQDMIRAKLAKLRALGRL